MIRFLISMTKELRNTLKSVADQRGHASSENAPITSNSTLSVLVFMTANLRKTLKLFASCETLL